MSIINGKKISEDIKNELKEEVKKLQNKNINPSIVIIQVGDNQASSVYVRNKLRLIEELSLKGELVKFPAEVNQEELLKKINELNNDKKVNGILVQLPLPKHINEDFVIEKINPIKDVDCFCLQNIGKLWTAKKSINGILPCTPAGIIEMLKRSQIELSGKNVVIVGRSNIVGKPLAALFLLENATVTICHSQTKNLSQICKNADILVPCIGKAKFITSEYIHKNQIIIDVGINRDENNKLCGDVDFYDVSDKIAHISPVPGGVGPMTIIMLLKNLITVTKIQNNL